MKPKGKAASIALFLMCSVVAAALGQDASDDRIIADRYRAAAHAGDPLAQFYLGAFYSAGVGVSQSDEQAVLWLSRAAERGHAHAMLIVSGLHVIGRGTLKDNITAYKWAAIVAAKAPLDELRQSAKELLNVLNSRMTRDEIAQARQLSNEWRLPQSASSTSRDQAFIPSTDVAPPPSRFRETSSETTQSPRSEPPNVSKVTPKDLDDLLSRIPPDIRKRIGR